MSFAIKCERCGEPIGTKTKALRLCEKCRDEMLGTMRDQRPPQIFPADWTFDDKIDKARELGISYGQFQARAYDGQYDMKTLQKAKNPKPLARQMRRELWNRVK